MLKVFSFSVRRICRRLRWPIRRRSKLKVSIRKVEKVISSSKPSLGTKPEIPPNGSALVFPNNHHVNDTKSETHIRIATFNAALFSMAPAVPNSPEVEFSKMNSSFDRAKSVNDRPKSILKQPPLHSTSLSSSATNKLAKSNMRVSINLPDNEISILKNYNSSFREGESGSSTSKAISRILTPKGPIRPQTVSFSANVDSNLKSYRNSGRTVVEVLRELNADLLALQDVKAEEEKSMRPLSDLAQALGMHYVFAESWAPQYGNAIMSKWPIKKSKSQNIFNDSDFRNVLKATIDVPEIGEVNLYCTLLDHLDENWRMKQINAIIQSSQEPHILVGGLNSLDETDYSQERWTDIVKYYEEMVKPTPKAEVMKFLKSKQYKDAKEFAGDCEPVVMIAKGQSVQGTCNYGTRVDYILASPSSPYEFVPGSYSVISSKGTSDHHMVKVDLIKKTNHHRGHENGIERQAKQPKQKRVVKISSNDLATKGIWSSNSSSYQVDRQR